ncbi:MAG: Crp/Fnr family transcriptional regulator [Sphingomonas bacterium]|jgi:CRP-like cAMP-binding protein|nr:Crp/Fnr family transcriptional regulator [Sphingomonas bacterium]MDB5717577.1 Crp/Fnr family transcriptional regulator [Sphingomonas bacterium]
MEKLFRKLEKRDSLSAEERQALDRAVSNVVEFAPRETIVLADVPLTNSNLLLDGLASRHKDLPDGQRQILEVHVPGDFIDLHSFLLKRLEHDVGALTSVRIAIVPHDRLKEITEAHPHLARLLWFSTLLDAAMHREWILSVGRRTAIARIAHLFCELLIRLEVVGLAEGHGYPLPLTQNDLADATGLTAVHVNRMLRELRDDGLMTFREGRVTIHDLPGLEKVAAFDPAYLYLNQRPR